MTEQLKPAATDPDRDPMRWTENEELAKIARSAGDEHVIGRFQTKGGIPMSVCKAGEWPLKGQLDATDHIMVGKGYDHLLRLIAFDDAERRAYAVWELYRRGDDENLRSKAIDVDCEHLHQGIGTGMRNALEAHGMTIIPSGTATKLGALFIASWSSRRSGADDNDASA